MPRKATGKVMVDKIWVEQKNGTWYCYERRRVWEDGQTKTIGKRLIGKSDERGGELRPTRPKRPPKPEGGGVGEAPEVTASREHTGMCDILEFIGSDSGIDEDLLAVTDEATAKKLISVSRFLVGTDGATLPSIEEWQNTHPLPYEHPITEDVYAQLFKDVGTDESIAQGFFARRIAREGDIGILCAYDSTTIDAETRDPEARDGMSKSHTGNRSIKVLVLYSMRTRRPLAYAKQPGNVPDVLSIENTVAMLKALGTKRVTIVTDVGFASELNLGTLLHSGDHVLTKVKTNWKWVREQIEAHWDELQRLTNIMKCDAMVKGITVDVTREFPFKRLRGSKKKGLKAGDTDRVTRRVHLHVYYDTERKCAQDREFIEDLWEVQSLVEEGLPLSKRQEDMRDKYLDVKKRGKKVTTAIREDEVNEACKYHGVFALVSDNIKDASEALETYREREWVEDYFERMKNDAGDHTARTGNPENLNGRLFAQFVAMCYLEELHERIRKMKDTLGKPNGDPEHDTEGNLDKERKLKAWLKKRSMYRTLLWFDAHETIKVSTDVAKRRWNTETVARDRLFLERLGVTKASA